MQFPKKLLQSIWSVIHISEHELHLYKLSQKACTYLLEKIQCNSHCDLLLVFI